MHLVSNSLGGWLAMEIAVRNCTRLKLTLAAGIRIAGKPIADIFMMDPDDLVREIFVDQSFADKILNTELTEEQVDVDLSVDNDFVGSQLSIPIYAWLHRISVPTHVIWGDTDKIVDPVYGRVRPHCRGIGGDDYQSAGHLRMSRNLNPSWRRCRVSFRRKPPEGLSAKR